MVATTHPNDQRLRLSAVSWETYLVTSDGLGPRRIRVTYDRGEMERTPLSPRHENRKTLLARLVEALNEELAIDIAGFGSMTCRRQDLERGLEPDECWWIAHESAVRGREDIDLAVDPPPDLVLEVEVSRGTLDRMGIYAALEVPEVWRHGPYRMSARRQRYLPHLRPQPVLPFPTPEGLRRLRPPHGRQPDGPGPGIPGMGATRERCLEGVMPIHFGDLSGAFSNSLKKNQVSGQSCSSSALMI